MLLCGVSKRGLGGQQQQRATAATGRLGSGGQCVIFHRSAVEHARSLTRSLSQSLGLGWLLAGRKVELPGRIEEEEEAPKGKHTRERRKKKGKNQVGKSGQGRVKSCTVHTHALIHTHVYYTRVHTLTAHTSGK